MGWAIGTGSYGRDIGYGVPAVCDQPGCDEEIDRGVSYACGNFRSDSGCGQYFCGKHSSYYWPEDEKNAEFPDEVGIEFCDHCLYYLEHPNAPRDDPKRPPHHDPKPDILQWVVWKLVAPSWAKWRELELDEVAKAFAVLDKHTIADVESQLHELANDLENDE